MNWILTNDRLPIESDGRGENKTILIWVDEGKGRGYHHLEDLDEYFYQNAPVNYLKENWRSCWSKWAILPK